MFGLFSQYLPRIPARWCYSFQTLLGLFSAYALYQLGLPPGFLAALFVIQALDLYIHNSDLVPTRPHTELWQNPKRAYDTKVTRFLKKNLGDFRVSGLPYPNFTGHVAKLKTLGYSGGMQLKLMAKWRNDDNPNGSGDHDWFRRNEDNGLLDNYRVRYAFTHKRIDWEPTSVERLYRNPRV